MTKLIRTRKNLHTFSHLSNNGGTLKSEDALRQLSTFSSATHGTTNRGLDLHLPTQLGLFAATRHAPHADLSTLHALTSLRVVQVSKKTAMKQDHPMTGTASSGKALHQPTLLGPCVVLKPALGSIPERRPAMNSMAAQDTRLTAINTCGTISSGTANLAEMLQHGHLADA